MRTAAPGPTGELADRCAIITGASRGLGLAIAERYVAAGANVMICARDSVMLDAAHERLSAAAGAGQRIGALPADVSQANDVDKLVAEAFRTLGRVDILVNNAAIGGPAGAVDAVDWRQWMRTIEINLLGPVLTSRAVLPYFKHAGRGKIVQLSGGGATKPLPNLSAYAVSKAAVIRFVETLAEETRAYRIDVNAIAPGTLDTRMLDEFIAAGPQNVGQDFYDQARQCKQSGGVAPGRGAELAVFLGSARSDGITGKLLSAVWDPWDALPGHLEELKTTDIYTLRRIVPRDRGMSWGDID
jgi:NAD(P)-dependent dehydrogenase (short-subunit alcohol dehydrogenase family)